MWMSARRLAVITRFVRVAFGKTNRASSPGMPAASSSPYSPREPVDLLLVAGAQVRVRLGDRARQHRRRALEGHVALALLVEGDAGAVAHQLVRQRPAHPADPEGEHDVLDRAAVAALDHPADQLLHLRRVDLAGLGAPEDLARLQLAVAGPAGRVDERDVVALDDLAVREEEGGLHPEIVAPGVAGDPGPRAGRGRAGTRDGGRRRLLGHGAERIAARAARRAAAASAGRAPPRIRVPAGSSPAAIGVGAVSGVGVGAGVALGCGLRRRRWRGARRRLGSGVGVWRGARASAVGVGGSGVGVGAGAGVGEGFGVGSADAALRHSQTRGTRPLARIRRARSRPTHR